MLFKKSRKKHNYDNISLSLDKQNYMARKGIITKKYIIYTIGSLEEANCPIIIGLTDNIDESYNNYRYNKKYSEYNLFAVLYMYECNDKKLKDIIDYIKENNYKIKGDGKIIYILTKI